MKALIAKDGRVVQLVEQEFPVHQEMKWIDAPEGCTTEHTYADGEFMAPIPVEIPPSLQIIALEAKQARAIREAVLTGDKTRLLEIESNISKLREKLP